MSKVLFDADSAGATYEGSVQYADDEAIGALLEGWQFFRPDAGLVIQILRLREKLGDDYLDKEYDRYGTTVPRLNDPDDAQAVPYAAEEISKKQNGIEGMLAQLTGILGLSRKEQPDSDTDADAIARHQSFISERIYNHLAMLGRTPRTLRGEAFSIRREFTAGIASKIGLGLYLSSEVHSDLREEAERVLLKLAGDYQQWFLEKTLSGCAVEATWGDIYEAHQSLSKKQRDEYPLLLIADVEEAAVAAG